MTALSLRRIVADALAEIGANASFARIPKGKPRSTTWLGIEHGFGIRHYAPELTTLIKAKLWKLFCFAPTFEQTLWNGPLPLKPPDCLGQS
jgi:hypothetical protein